ncbi:MAG: putative DNA base hypermodification protein [Actinomycetota bacterium]|nr:putative DNA base hypermodification protein [Actinomycetota bacterium]
MTEVFWSYWHVAAERQAMFFRRLNGESPPWTDDAVLRHYRFTNAYRASDRVSQFLLQRVIYGGTYEAEDVVLRVLLFKIFNRVETWEWILDAVGDVTTTTFDPDVIGDELSHHFAAGDRLYSAAYIMPNPQLGSERKHVNHLALLDTLRVGGRLSWIASAGSLRELYARILSIPSFGPFLAFQYAIDLNYSDLFDFSEMDYVVAGPGALRGIAKCFVDTSGLAAEGVIRSMTHDVPAFMEAAGVDFSDLWGRPLQLIDCQNLFCEVDKYARVVHPDMGARGPARIKQNFRPNPAPLRVGYPPKWQLPATAGEPASVRKSDGRGSGI